MSSTQATGTMITLEADVPKVAANGLPNDGMLEALRQAVVRRHGEYYRFDLDGDRSGFYRVRVLLVNETHAGITEYILTEVAAQNLKRLS